MSNAMTSIACIHARSSGPRRSASPTASPNPVIASPQTRIATITARPCASTRETQPLSTPPSTAPAGIAANRSANTRPPSEGPPKSMSAISGNSARGIPKTIAMMSTTNDISSTGWWRR